MGYSKEFQRMLMGSTKKKKEEEDIAPVLTQSDFEDYGYSKEFKSALTGGNGVNGKTLLERMFGERQEAPIGMDRRTGMEFDSALSSTYDALVAKQNAGEDFAEELKAYQTAYDDYYGYFSEDNLDRLLKEAQKQRDAKAKDPEWLKAAVALEQNLYSPDAFQYKEAVDKHQKELDEIKAWEQTLRQDKQSAKYIQYMTLAGKEDFEQYSTKATPMNDFVREMEGVEGAERKDAVSNLSEDELSVYNYLYNKEGRKKADEFYEFLKGYDLNRRQAVAKAKHIQDMGFLGETTMSVGTNFGAGVQDWAGGMKSLFTGDPAEQSASQIAAAILTEEAGPVASKVYGASRTVGNMAPSILLSKGLGTVSGALGASANVASKIGQTAGAVSMGTSAAGNAYSQKIAEGWEENEARTYGLLVGASEVATERIFNGIPGLGGAIDADDFVRTLNGSFSRLVAGGVINMAGEVAEEELQLLLEPAIEKMVVGGEYKAPTGKEALDTALVTMLSTGAMNAPRAIGLEINYNKYGKMVQEQHGWKELADRAQKLGAGTTSAKIAEKISAEPYNVSYSDIGRLYTQMHQDGIFEKLTENEQKVVDAIFAKETEGKDLSKKEQEKLRKEIVREMDEGNITADYIESVLGGDEYTALQDTLKSENEALQELSGLYKGEELKAEVEKFIENSESKKLKAQLRENVSGMVKGERLYESYREIGRATQKFTADVSKYNKKYRAIIQRAIDSGSVNNSRYAHRMVETVAKFEAHLGAEFDFSNTKKINEAGYGIEGKITDGYVDENGNITINMQSPKVWNFIVGHEITHLAQDTKFGDKLNEVLFEYAKGRKAKDSKFENEYMERLHDARERYKNIKSYQGLEGDKKIKREVAADLVGDYLFNDREFVDHLAKHRNLFQWLWNDIKRMANIMTAGSEEAKQLERIKKTFEDAYRKAGKGVSNNGEVQHSIRNEEPPKNTKKAYKLMRLVDGKLYPLFIGNNEEVSVGTWYNADSPNLSQLKDLEPGTHLVDMTTGEAITWDEYAKDHVPMKDGKPARSKPNVSDIHWANDNGYRFMHIEDKAGGASEGRMLKQYGDTRAYYNWGVNGSSKSKSGEGSASLYAMRPGWHFGEVPSMHQIGYGGTDGDTVRLDNQVWVEVEMSADVDYNAEAESNWGGDIPTHIPENGYYRFATNPTQKKTKSGDTANDATKADWYVAGAFKVNRILSDSEADAVVEKYNKDTGRNVPLDYRRNGGRVFNAETMSVEEPVRYSLSDAKVPTLEELAKKPPVKVVDISTPQTTGTFAERRSKILANASEVIAKPYRNADTGAMIFLTEKSYTHAFHNPGELLLNAMEHLPELVENAVLTHAEQPTHGSEYATGVYTFFAAAKADGVRPVKLKVKEYAYNGQDLPKNIKAYFDSLPQGYAASYDTVVLEVEEIEKSPSGSAKDMNHEAGSFLSPDELSAINVADLMGLVKGDAKKYVPTFSVSEYAPTFYSNMERVAEGVKQEKLGAASVVSMLRGKGVKAEEIKWSGIETWLDGKKSVTKQELLEFMRANRIDVQEKVRDNKKDDAVFKRLSPTTKGLFVDGKLVETYLSKIGDRGYVAEMNDPDNYFPESWVLEKHSHRSTKWGEYKLDGGKNYREVEFVLPDSTYSNGAMQNHWGKDAQGVIAHARVQDFKDGGKKMLFIEEIQSDWHNEGHKKGYDIAGEGKTDIRNKSGDAYRAFVQSDVMRSVESRLWRSDYNGDVTTLLSDLFDGNKGAYADVLANIELSKEERTFIDKAVAEEAKRQEQIANAPENTGVPDAPFKENYHEFVLKRLLRQAAENGYASIGWTTADTQSARWSDKYAEGYRIEYDQDIPKFLNKYGKQWGAKVGKTTLRNGTEVWTMPITDAMKQSVLYEGQPQYSVSDSKEDLYSRIYDMQIEVNKLTESIREIEATEEFKTAERKLFEAIHGGDIDAAIKDYAQWKKESGHEGLVSKRDALQNDLERLRKDFDDKIANEALDEEKAAVEKSGLSEAEYFRKQAVKEFGYTPYFYDAGYIVPNGKMLNFSGEKGKHFGSRGQDHRAIGMIYANTSGTAALNRFMRDGNIRIMAESPGIDISTIAEPSKEQYATIRKFINEYSGKGYFNVDLSDADGRVVGSLEYENRVNATRIVNDIKHYFSTGEIREQSVVDSFRYSVSDSDGRELSTAVQKRFANSKVLDEDGNLKVVYHGTASGEFTIFDKAKGSVEGDFGSGFYFTDNEADVEENYEDGGPDFENKVARLAERIEAEEEIDYDEAEERARAELYKGGHKFEVYLNIENPAVVGETILLDGESYLSEYNEEDYDDYDDYIADVEQLLADDIENIVWEVEKNVDVDNAEGIAGVLYDAYAEGGIGIEELKAKINELYLEDSEGNLVGNEVTRQIIESLGYDGIIDPTVSTKWNMNMDAGTTHYIVFKPNQIKAVTNENPTDNPDIHRSISEEGETAELPIRGDFNIPTKYLAYDPDAEPDIGFAPVRKDVGTVAENATVEDVAPVAEDEGEFLERLESLTDEDAPPLGKIRTVRDRLEAKMQNFQTELNENKRLREESIISYGEEIERLKGEYNATKNKNTKKANDLLRRIERTERMKGNVDADYAKRISDLEGRVQKTSEELRSGQSPTEQKAMRTELHQSIVDKVKARFAAGGYDFDSVLKNAKNLSTFSTVDNIPQRVMEKSLGYKEGQILSDMTVDQVARNETEGIKWLNSFTDRKNGVLANLSKKYGIKPGSKESAAAQMYAEGFYVAENNDIIEYGDAELAKDFPDAKVRNNIKGLARDPAIRQIYDETLAAINESRTRNAYPEIQKLDNYFLHFRAMDDTFSRLGLPFNPKDIKVKDLPTDLNGVTADLKPGQPYFASAMHRTGKRTSFDLLGGLEKYLTSAKGQIYHIDDIQTLRALRNYIADTYGQANGLEGLDALTEEEAQERIRKVYGSHLSTFAKFLNEEANVIAGKTALIDRGLEGIIGRRGITFLGTVNKQVGANMVGFNVSSSLTNILASVQAFAKMNKAAFVKGFAQMVQSKLGSIVGKTDAFVENNPTIIRRKGADSFYRTPFQKVGDAGYLLMSAVDNISTEIIVRAKYNELIQKGMSHDDAIVEADKWTSRLMGDRSLGQQPHLYNSKMLGILTKFQLEVRNQLDSQFYDTIKEAQVSNEDIQNAKARNAKTAAKVASTFFQLAVAQHLFGKAFESIAGYNPAFDIISVIATALGWDDEEDSEDTAQDNIEQGFMELLEDLPYTSTFTGGRIPIQSALPVEQFAKGEDQYGNEKSRWETLGEIAPYYALPGGYGQIKKTVAGLKMFSDDHPVSGSYTDSGNLRFPVEKTPLNVAQAALFGQYANKNAREYFDRDLAPLNPKQIEEYQDVDLPISEYWDYRQGLKGLDKLEEKADYIYDLDLPMRKQNLLINNIADRKEDIDLTGYGLYDSLEEFDYANKNPEKYSFLSENNISYAEWKFFDDDTKDAWNWAFDNPEKMSMAKAISGDVVDYRRLTSELYDLKADKDSSGKTISGSKKQKVLDYINGLDLDYGQKIILYRSQYSSQEDRDMYNAEIVEYLNSREDLSYEEIVDILKGLDFTVTSDGNVYWD